MIRAGVTLFRFGGRRRLDNVTPAAILACYYELAWPPGDDSQVSGSQLSGPAELV
jgi:hypothetical protein